MMVTGSNNEAAALVSVGSCSERSNKALPHWTDSNTPVLLSGSSTPVCAVKTKKARDNTQSRHYLQLLQLLITYPLIIE